MGKILIRNRNAGKTYKDGRKKEANWEFRFQTASTNGKQSYYSESGFRTKKEAAEAGAKAQSEYLCSGQVFIPSEMSVADYFDYWIKSYCETNLKETSVEGYKKKIRLYIKPAIGHYYLNSISPSVLQDFINTEFNEGFSRNTLSSIKGILSGAFEYAVEPCRFISSNPCISVKLPLKRAIPDTPSRKKVKRPVTNEEWEQIMARFPEGESSHIPLVLAYRCGLRLGEVFGLMWEDIDFENSTLRVDRQVQKNNETKAWRFVPPKYDSYRTISLDQDTLSLLKREHDKQQRAKVYYDTHYTQLYVHDERDTGHFIDSGFMSKEISARPVHMIMSRDSGEYIQPRIIQHVGRIIHGTYKEGYPVISADWDFHSLRHTHATMLYENGVPLSVIQKRLGHTKIHMTEKYTHVTEKMENDLLEKLSTLYK